MKWLLCAGGAVKRSALNVEIPGSVFVSIALITLMVSMIIREDRCKQHIPNMVFYDYTPRACNNSLTEVNFLASVILK